MRNLEALLLSPLEDGGLDIPKRARRLALLDVHSGLGPQGVDTLLTMPAATTAAAGDNDAESSGSRCNGSDESEECVADIDLLDAFVTEFDVNDQPIGGVRDGGKSNDAATGAAAAAVNKGYELTIGTTSNFCTDVLAARLPPRDRACLTQASICGGLLSNMSSPALIMCGVFFMNNSSFTSTIF